MQQKRYKRRTLAISYQLRISWKDFSVLQGLLPMPLECHSNAISDLRMHPVHLEEQLFLKVDKRFWDGLIMLDHSTCTLLISVIVWYLLSIVILISDRLKKSNERKRKCARSEQIRYTVTTPNEKEQEQRQLENLFNCTEWQTLPNRKCPKIIYCWAWKIPIIYFELSNIWLNLQ